MQLLEVADELYSLPPHEFTQARDAAVQQARDAGDRELASLVKQLRRPSVSAWVVNTLARRRPEQLEELFELGASLRQAQQELAGADLRALSPRRYQLIKTLLDEARKLLDKGESKLTGSIQREVHATLEAALADEQAAAAVRCGRLMRALSSGGFEAVDLTGAVAAFDGTSTPVRRSPSSRSPSSRSPTIRSPTIRSPTISGESPRPAKGKPREQATTGREHTPSETSSRKDEKRNAGAQRAVAAARQRAERAALLLADCDAAVAAAREALHAGQARVSELEQALKQARTDQHNQHANQQRADRDRATAARQHQAAQRHLASTRATLTGQADH